MLNDEMIEEDQEMMKHFEGETLIIKKADSSHSFSETVKKDIKRLKNGEEVDLVTEVTQEEFNKLQSERRIRTIEKLLEETPESIRELHRELNIGLRELHEDLKMFQALDIVYLQSEGNRKIPIIPYSAIKMENLIQKKEPEAETA